MLLSLRTRLPFDLLAAWADLRSLPAEVQVATLADPDRRAPYVRAAVEAEYDRYTGLGAQARPPDFDGIRVYQRGLPPNPSVAEVARARRVHPAEAMIDLCVESGGDQLFIQPSLYPQDEAVLLRALRHPRAVMTFSDSGAHLSQIADSSIHTHLLGHWVRDRQEFSLEEAVRMITLAPAVAWGFADRGLLRPGMAADVNVFDPAHRGPGRAPPGRRPARRRPAPRAAVGGVRGHPGQRRGDHRGRSTHRGLAGAAPAQPADLTGSLSASRASRRPAAGSARFRRAGPPRRGTGCPV